MNAVLLRSLPAANPKELFFLHLPDGQPYGARSTGDSETCRARGDYGRESCCQLRPCAMGKLDGPNACLAQRIRHLRRRIGWPLFDVSIISFGVRRLTTRSTLNSSPGSLRTVGELDEIANAIAFLASPLSGYITGINTELYGSLPPSL